MAQQKVQMMSNLNGRQLSRATRDYLTDLLDISKDNGPVSMKHYYQVLFKDKIAAAEATNITGHLERKLVMRDRLRKRLESKRR